MSQTQAINAIPRHFWIMLICVLGFGIWAGNTVLPTLLFTTPVLAGLLFRVQLRETRARVFNEQVGLHQLAGATQAHVRAILLKLPDGEVRDLLVGIVRVGSNASANLPRGYADTDYGLTVEELIRAAADTALHAHSFEHTLRELEAQPANILKDSFDLLDAVEQTRAARDARIAQLTTVLRVLSEIGPDIADGGDAGTRRIIEILDSLKREVAEHDAAETEIDALLHR
jgi:hypothetical protein